MSDSDRTHLVSDDDEVPVRNKPMCGALARYTVVFLGFLGFANVYAMRVNLSVAIVYMVNHTAIDAHNNGSSGGGGGGGDEDVCPLPSHNGTVKHLHDGK